TRKGMRGVGWEAYVTSRDPTLEAVGTRSCAIRRGMSKKRATAIFDRSLRVGPPSLCVLRGLLCKFSLLPSVRAGFKSGSPKILAKLRDVPCQQCKDHEDNPFDGDFSSRRVISRLYLSTTGFASFDSERNLARLASCAGVSRAVFSHVSMQTPSSSF